MSRAIHRLKSEHQGFYRLLDVLERQLNALLRGQSPDYYLMRDILRYLLDYPDHYHHPYEDLVYDRLVRRAPREAERVEDLHREHRQLAVHGREALGLVERLLSDDVVTRTEVHAAGSAYTSEYRAHMRREEEVVFASAAAHLTPADWLQIDTMLHWRPDPLFGPTIEGQYQALHERIRIETRTRRRDRSGEAYCDACSTA